VVASVSLFTSERKDALWVKSQSQSIPPPFFLTIFSTNDELSPLDRYLVYNLRKRGGDSADKYFKSTELIAGVKDMRFQALMPDVLHWLGITKIDNMISMSDMWAFPDISYRIYSYLCPVPPGNTMRLSVPGSQFSNDTTFQVRTFTQTCNRSDIGESDHLIPMDSRVEIDAKIAAGYFTSGKQIAEQDLSKTVGRAWEEADH